MSRDERDREPDESAPVTPAEQARAEAFGRWLDGLAAGAPLPPAMDSEDRALLETATMVLASSHAVELGPDRTRRLVDQALENAVLGRSPRRLETETEAEGDSENESESSPGLRIEELRLPRREREAESSDREAAARSSTDLVVAGRRQARMADRVLRNLPWAVASLAAAAAVVLFVTRPAEDTGKPEATLAPLRVDTINTSRPADPLVGVISRSDSGRARERMDIIFADRMDGYRDLYLRRALRKGTR
jgi:hypothetical protein